MLRQDIIKNNKATTRHRRTPRRPCRAQKLYDAYNVTKTQSTHCGGTACGKNFFLLNYQFASAKDCVG